MAQIILNVPDDKEQRFIDAFAKAFSWHSESGMTKRQFMKSKLKNYMKEILYRVEIGEANRIASENLRLDVDTIDVD